MEQSDGRFYEFGPFRIDPGKRLLLRDGKPVPLTPKSFDMLLTLVQHSGEVLEKDQLLKMLWPDSIVEEANLPQNISALRKALGESPSERRYIVTIPGRGYRFAAEVKQVEPEPSTRLGQDGVTDRVAVPLSAPVGLDQVKISESLREQASQTGYESLPQSPAIPSKPLPGARPVRSLARRFFWLAVALVAAFVASLVFWNPLDDSARTPPLRTVPFTTLAGREMWPAFSPDGNQIAFSWEGDHRNNFDIYTQLLGTDKPLRLTQDPAVDGFPAWSPDGRSIAFTRKREGEEVTLHTIPALGGPERKLGSLNFKGAGHFNTLTWSPAGDLLAFADNTGTSDTSIWLLSLDTLKKRQLTRLPAGYMTDLYPTFSPDGKTVAFTRWSGEGMADVYVVPVKGGQPLRLTSDHCLVPGLAWMPDGKSIVFSSTRGGSLQLWKVPSGGGTPELLPSGGDNPLPTLLSPFAISRIGSRLAYEKSTEDRNIWRFEISDGTTSVSPPVKLIASTQYEGGPQFSPDGERIAFESYRSGAPEVWVCDADGSNALKLTSFGGPLAGTPRWSPDGQMIAFDARLGNHSDIFVVSGTGGAVRQVTKEPSNDVVPSWSRDGRCIYFASRRGREVNIWKIPASGGEAVQVTRNGGFSAFESIDGKFLYYSKITQSGVWKMPVSGGKETLVADVVAVARWGYWALAPKGIYFVNLDSPGNHTIDFFDFSTEKVSQVASVSEPMRIEHGDPALAVSPDGRWILYNQLDRAESDIMLVENFR